eukprot:TRINITY_DN1835_c0_g1_i2.p2 TRINITY_DN1835_c0_g1~~TRINITY_DN1835_c0_g1_i2.p2  ORF type:complete len:197 (-),score=71.25 TRINITY_DN1835_c0_g1_i2:13-603(-)
MADNVVQFNRELADREKAVQRLTKSNEAAQGKLKQLGEEVVTLLSTTSSLENAAAARKAAYEATITSLQQELKDCMEERDMLAAAAAAQDSAGDSLAEIADKDRQLEELRVSSRANQERAAAEQQELRERLSMLAGQLEKRHMTQMKWVQQVWNVKEAMTAEQLREARETIHMVTLAPTLQCRNHLAPTQPRMPKC